MRSRKKSDPESDILPGIFIARARDIFIALLIIFTPYCKLTSAAALPGAPPSTVAIVADPEHVAVPLPRVAEVGAAVAPAPLAVITSAVPPAIVFVPVRATVAVAVEELLNAVKVHVWVALPVMDPPLVYVPDATPVAEYKSPSENTRLPVVLNG